MKTRFQLDSRYVASQDSAIAQSGGCRQRLRFRLAFYILWTLVAGCTMHAQALKPLRIEDALRGRSFAAVGLASMNYSPDGAWIAYVVSNNEKTPSLDRDAAVRSGVPYGVTGDDIWISNTQTMETRNLTGGKGENWLPEWSPDGNQLAFLSDRDGSGQAKLWVWNRKSGSMRKVSDLAARTDRIEWSPDSRTVFLTVVPEEMDIEGYIAKVQTDATSRRSVTGKTEGSTVVLYRSPRASREHRELPRSDPWNLNMMLRDLASLDVVSGKSRYLVRGARISQFLIAPDGSRVVYTSPRRFERPGSQQILYDLVALTITTNRVQPLASDIRLGPDGGEFSWSPDSRLVGFHVSGMEETNRDCYVVTAEGGTLRKITHFEAEHTVPRRNASVPLWGPKGDVYLIREGALWRASADKETAVKIAELPNHSITSMIAQRKGLIWTTGSGRFAVALAHDEIGKQDGFFRIDLADGKVERLLEKGQCYTYGPYQAPWAVSGDGKRFAFLAEDAQHPPDLWTTDATFGSVQRLTDLNPQYHDYEMGRVQLIDWLSEDGEKLSGALLLPAGYQKGKRYPLVVWVYGGDWMSLHYDEFGLVASGPYNMQLLATRGYAVLLPDSPQHEGTPMLDLAKTVLPGVNKVIEMGVADPDRLGVMGQSNGGYSTLGLIVQTQRFKAAIEVDGMADLVSHYVEMSEAGETFGISLERGQNALGGSLWERRERYIENSPFFYLDRVETPLLVVHGTDDFAVASFQGDKLFVGLRRLGKEVEYAKYKGEGHTQLGWSHPNQVDFCNRMLAWLEKYLTPNGVPSAARSAE